MTDRLIRDKAVFTIEDPTLKTRLLRDQEDLTLKSLIDTNRAHELANGQMFISSEVKAVAEERSQPLNPLLPNGHNTLLSNEHVSFAIFNMLWQSQNVLHMAKYATHTTKVIIIETFKVFF